MFKVSVIVVNWNRLELTKNCLRSLAGQTYRDFEIIVVDNGSTDGSERLATIRNEKNLGFSKAVNQGIRRAHGQYIALINNDATANRYWLEELVHAADTHRECASFASLVLRPDGSIDSAGCYLWPDGNGMCRGRGKYPFRYSKPGYVDFPSGCAALYRNGWLFDEGMFAYNEDTELGIQMQRARWKCWYVPTAIVTHLYSQSTAAYSLKKLWWVEKNRLRIMAKHFTVVQILRSIPWTAIRYGRMVAGCLK